MTNKTIGKYGEQLAKNFLIKKGFEILELNYRYSRLAEIDIIAKKADTIHFIEVKTRTQNFFGEPLEAINQNKLKSIYKCALYYMQNVSKKTKKYQIDAIGIVLNKENEPNITYIENLAL